MIESGSVEGLWRWECGGRSVEGCIGTGWKCRRVQVWKDAGGSVEGCRCGGGSVEECRYGVEVCRCGGMQVGGVWKDTGMAGKCRGVQVWNTYGSVEGAGVEGCSCGGVQV